MQTTKQQAEPRRILSCAVCGHTSCALTEAEAVTYWTAHIIRFHPAA